MNNIIKRKWNQNSMVIIEDLQGMAFQAESGGHTFQISGVDGEGNAVALSGTPAGVLLRADGQDVTLTCSVSGGVVSATLPANAYVVPGRFGLTIFLTRDGQKTAIYAAVGTVGKTSSGTVAPPAGSDVVTLVNQINAAIAAIPVSYNSCFAPAYSTSGLYSVGQYVTYNGNLYRCTTAITTAESWTAAHWTQTNLGADVYDLKSALTLSFTDDENKVPASLFSITGLLKGNLTVDAGQTNYKTTDFIELYTNECKIAGPAWPNAVFALFALYDADYQSLFIGYGANSFSIDLANYPTAKYFRASKANADSVAISVTPYNKAANNLEYLRNELTASFANGNNEIPSGLYSIPGILNSAGTSVSGVSGWKTTDYIELFNYNGVISGYGFPNNVYSTFALYDKQKNVLCKNGFGDFSINLFDYPQAKYFRASKEDSSNTYYVKIKNDGVPIDNVKFNNPDASDNVFRTNSATDWSISDGVITCNYNTSSGNTWCYYNIHPNTIEESNNIINVEFDTEINTDSKIGIGIIGKNGPGSTTVMAVAEIDNSGHYNISIDVNHAVVYYALDMTKTFSVFISNATAPCYATINNLKITAKKYDFGNDVVYKDLNKMKQDIDSNTNNIEALKGNQYLVSPNGTKYKISITNDGTVIAIPVIPEKTLFIGNSLLLGNGTFGMCASASDKDYYHYVSQAILEKKPNATFDKLAGSAFETCSTVFAAESWMESTLLPHLGNDINLVVIQLGDNVPTDKIDSVFATTCPALIEYIHNNAPLANILFVAEWYPGGNKQEIIANACASKGATFIDITPLRTSENRSYIGAVVNYGTSETRVYSFDSYTDDSTNNKLSITFTVNGSQYTSVVPYESYSVSGSSISIVGTYGIVIQSGVASHPGDSGMSAIANLIIEILGLN